MHAIEEKDCLALFEIFSEISRDGISWPYSYNLTEAKFRSIWFAPENRGYAIWRNGEIAGAYFIKTQWPDRGSHVATAQYMVSSRFRGHGIGSSLVAHSIETAKSAGYQAMQYNLVVSSNKAALALYEKHGFRIAGTLPKAYDHPLHGLIDAYILHRFL